MVYERSPRSPGRSLDDASRNGVLSSADLRRTESDDSLDFVDWENARHEPESPKSMLYLFILALGIGGVSLSWATETSAGTPYLQSLGMSKSLLALVWMAGPLGGVLVQPYVGIRSDNCRIKWGKRLPFMVGGAIATAVSFLCLSSAREIVRALLVLLGAEPDSEGAKFCIITFATFWVYVLDFAINVVQAAVRAFIVDNAPFHQQDEANAWASRIIGVGNIIGYVCGYLDLPNHVSWLGRSQMQILCAISALTICGTVSISALYISERDPRLEGAPAKNPGLLAFFKQTTGAAVRMPEQIRKVCIAQFFNWLGWFGFLFYMTTYVGQIKLNPYLAAHPDLTSVELEHAWEDATRYATFALLIFAITSSLANFFLPLFVEPSFAGPTPSSKLSRSSASLNRSSSDQVLWFGSGLRNLFSLLQIPGLTLRRIWLLSHITLALLMFSTFFVSSYVGATVLTALIGIPWAVTQWAPFALISTEISKRDTEARRNRIHGEGSANKREDQAGVILGLHNVSVSAPQILATIISSLIFKVFQKPRGEPYDASVDWVLRFGGLAALAAAYCTIRIAEESDDSKTNRSYRRYERVLTAEDTVLSHV